MQRECRIINWSQAGDPPRGGQEVNGFRSRDNTGEGRGFTTGSHYVTQSGLLLNLAKQTRRWFLFNEDEILRAGGRRDVFKVRLVFYFCTFSWIRFQFSGSKPQTSVRVVPAVKINCQLRVSTSLTTTHTLFIHYYQCIFPSTFLKLPSNYIVTVMACLTAVWRSLE